jgi:hypothetical protein
MTFYSRKLGARASSGRAGPLFGRFVPRSWTFSWAFIFGSSFLEKSAATRLTVAYTGCGSRVAGLRVLKMFWVEGLCGMVLGVEDILFMRGRPGLATGG